MYKKYLDKLSRLRNDLNAMEDEFKDIGHELGHTARVEVDQTLSKFCALRGWLWAVDKALEGERDKQCDA